MLRLSIFALLFCATAFAGCSDDIGPRPGAYCTFNDATQEYDTETTCTIGHYCMGGFTKRLPCPASVMDQCNVEGLSAPPELDAAV